MWNQAKLRVIECFDRQRCGFDNMAYRPMQAHASLDEYSPQAEPYAHLHVDGLQWSYVRTVPAGSALRDSKPPPPILNSMPFPV